MMCIEDAAVPVVTAQWTGLIGGPVSLQSIQGQIEEYTVCVCVYVWGREKERERGREEERGRLMDEWID